MRKSDLNLLPGPLSFLNFSISLFFDEKEKYYEQERVSAHRDERRNKKTKRG